MDHVIQGNWHLVTNHTPNDPNGYMMLINADDKQAGIFYQATIPNLCPGTTYKFGAWIINLMAKPGIRPNLKFSIETTSGALIKDFDTGEIPEGSKDDWKEFFTVFTTGPAISEVVVKIKNIGLGGGGNDFCLDDITFRPYGPEIKPAIDGALGQTANICTGDTKTFTLSADVTSGVYNVPQYLWQRQNITETWEDLPAETTNTITAVFTNAQTGTYKYRLLVAETGNINSENCRSNSPEFNINVNALPTPGITAQSSVCIGTPINLSTGSASTYTWTGPNNFSSSVQSPSIPLATADMAGVYTVEVTNASGCKATASTNIAITPLPQAAIAPITPICEGEAVNLQASGGITYKWTPIEGLSAADIPNPIANPTKTTLYTVVVSNGTCETEAQVNVVVFKKPQAIAGSDKKIFEGQSTTLNGLALGDNITFSWSPTEGLDNPRKQNPIASPTKDITYTLTVTSDCNTVTDDVFVRVYQNITIPNTFSPNGDGTNDLWQMDALNTYPNATVKVMNRYGELVFQSVGYEKPWDGKYKNADLPIGVYYYIIGLGDGQKPRTGSVTILR